jgi:hypothetical protein
VALGSVTVLDQLDRKEEGMVNGRLWNTNRRRLAFTPRHLCANITIGLISQCNCLRLVLIKPSPCNIPLSF